MTATKKTMRFLTVLALIFAMVFSIMSVPASAAGVEDWGWGGATSPFFDVHGYNLTPVKTLTDCGILYVEGTFCLSDTKTNSNPANCTLEIRNTAGKVLASGKGKTNSYGTCVIDYINIWAWEPGEKVQIYTGVYDSVTGAARRARVCYTWAFSPFD